MTLERQVARYGIVLAEEIGHDEQCRHGEAQHQIAVSVSAVAVQGACEQRDADDRDEIAGGRQAGEGRPQQRCVGLRAARLAPKAWPVRAAKTRESDGQFRDKGATRHGGRPHIGTELASIGTGSLLGPEHRGCMAIRVPCRAGAAEHRVSGARCTTLAHAWAGGTWRVVAGLHARPQRDLGALSATGLA